MPQCWLSSNPSGKAPPNCPADHWPVLMLLDLLLGSVQLQPGPKPCQETLKRFSSADEGIPVWGNLLV